MARLGVYDRCAMVIDDPSWPELSDVGLAMPLTEIVSLIAKQLGNLLAFDAGRELAALERALPGALQRSAACFLHAQGRYYTRDGRAYFDPFQTSQSTILLYCLSNALGRQGDDSLADRVYYLNKILHGVDLFHRVELPSIFNLDHPVGTVIGRGTFGNCLYFSQGCTVGNNRNIFPVLGKYNVLTANVTILGNCRTGDYCVFGAGAMVIDEEVPDYSLVFGRSPHLTIRVNEPGRMLERIRRWWKI
jgi:serine O-acetyltransferase